MEVKPLPKSLFDRAKEMGATKIELHFSGGSDNGYLDVWIEGANSRYYDSNTNSLATDIESWAWDVYQYSGAGDGNDYGDDITYDLVEMTASWNEWFMQRTEGRSKSGEIGVKDGD